MRVPPLICATLVRAAIATFVAIAPAQAQDMMRNLDLKSPKMTEAEMTREALVEMLHGAAAPLDLSGAFSFPPVSDRIKIFLTMNRHGSPCLPPDRPNPCSKPKTYRKPPLRRPQPAGHPPLRLIRPSRP